MHIVYFFTFGYSLKSWHSAGILEREIRIFEELVKKYDLRFTLVTYGDAEDYRFTLNEGIEIVPIYTLLKKSKNKFYNFFKSFFISTRIKLEIHNFDIIQQNQLMGSWVSVLFKYSTKKPLYIRTGYDMFLFSIKDKKSIIKKAAYFVLTFLSHGLTNLYSVTSICDAAFLKKFLPFSENKLVVRPNWVENNVTKEFNTRYIGRLLAVGRFETQKNYPILIKSLKNTGLSLDIVGSGSMENELRNLAKLEGVEVNFLGILQNNELMKLYTKYKYFVSTSLYEGNPKAILEAMCSGCIVIAREIPNNKEIITNLENGVLFNNDSEFKEIIKNIEFIKNQEKISNRAIESTVLFNSLDKLVDDIYYDFKLLKKLTE